MRQVAVERKALEMSTPAQVQLPGQSDTLDFQRFTLWAAVKILTFAAVWQNLDGPPDSC